MSVSRILDSAALVVLSAFALCLAALSQGALAGSAPTFRNIRVDVQPLRANAGDPTARWVEQDLSGQLAQALSGRMARDGAPLIVRIDYLTLGPSTGEMLHASASIDNIQGVAVINGQETPIRASNSYYTNPIDQTMIERSNRDRVAQLTQVLAYWIGHGVFF